MGNLSADELVRAINSAKALTARGDYNVLLGDKVNAVDKWLAAGSPGYGPSMCFNYLFDQSSDLLTHLIFCNTLHSITAFSQLKDAYGDDAVDRQGLAQKVFDDVKGTGVSARGSSS